MTLLCRASITIDNCKAAFLTLFQTISCEDFVTKLFLKIQKDNANDVAHCRPFLSLENTKETMKHPNDTANPG